MTLPHHRAALAAAAVLAASSFTVAADADTAGNYWVYLGTYTGKDGSKGIYRSRLDAKTGKLAAAELAAEMGSPSFLAIHPTEKYLYAVGEGGGKEGGPVVAFALDGKTGALTKLNETKSGGGGPCHISIHPKGTFATVANYGGGSTGIFRLGEDGKVGERTAFIQHSGKGKDPGRQKGPHAHCSFFMPGGEVVLTVDLGIDRVKVFAFNPATGRADDTGSDVVTPPGSGPRHIAIAPDGDFAYVCGELDSTVNVIDFAPGGKVIQTLSTLPEPVKGNSTAECILHPSGKFVYVSNRGHNSIAVFKVGALDRKLTAAGHITGDIKTPRNFNVDPTGKWMLIASQDGGKVEVFEIDAATGSAKPTGNAVSIARCVCVKFVPVK
jgi:6-phosphogluconolactonase